MHPHAKPVHLKILEEDTNTLNILGFMAIVTVLELVARKTYLAIRIFHGTRAIKTTFIITRLVLNIHSTAKILCLCTEAVARGLEDNAGQANQTRAQGGLESGMTLILICGFHSLQLERGTGATRVEQCYITRKVQQRDGMARHKQKTSEYLGITNPINGTPASTI